MKSNIVVIAPFDQDGKHYEPGDTFTIPEGWKFVPQEGVFNSMKFVINSDRPDLDEGDTSRSVILPIRAE